MKLKLINFLDSIDISNITATVAVSDAVFGCAFNPKLIHQVVSSYLTNSRQGTKAQKSRSEVIGSNKKPWRQKGTGRARSGSVKSPIWRSGGVTFAASPKKYFNKTNKKMFRGALRSILSKLVYENRLFLIENLCITQPKTKLLLEKLEKITLNKSMLILTDILDKNVFLASRNLYKIEMHHLNCINPISLINFNITLIDHNIVNEIEKKLR